jgi:hypothetical protein
LQRSLRAVRLIGGVFRVLRVPCDQLPGLLLGEVQLIMLLTGVSQDLSGQLRVIVGFQVDAARAFEHSHFVLLLPPSPSGLEFAHSRIVPSRHVWRIN